MERDDAIGLGKVATTSGKQKNEDSFPFSKKPSSTSRYGSWVEVQPTRKRPTPSGPMDKIFQQERRDEMDLTIELYFYLNFISFNVAQTPFFIEMC